MLNEMAPIISNTSWDVQDLLKIAYITLPLLIAVVILGIAILWNQRKIKKMLREMQEQKDKPQ